MGRRLIIGVAAVVALAGSGCGDPAASVSKLKGRDIKALTLAALPAEIDGLTIAPEDVSATIAPARNSQVEALGVYSLRTGDLLQATLQVSRLRTGARFHSAAFHGLVTSQIGSSAPRRALLGSTSVYLTTGTQQRIAVWFTGRYFFILAIREDFRHPRTLIRHAIEIKP
jgi:hypothetical protein